ncbi:MAG: PQQ-dependent sugar dehydrogenase, partial [Bacteroidota bacterium]
IKAAFYPGTKMFLYNGTDSAFVMTSEEYAALYSRRTPGTKNGRFNRIVSLDIANDVAYAKIEVDIPSFGNRYSDLLLLKKILGDWKIVAKATSAVPIPKKPVEMMVRPMKETILEGLKKPWSMAFLSEEEVIIAEKDGGLLLINLTTESRTAIKGLPKDVARAVTIDTTKYKRGVFPSSLHGKTLSFNAGWFQVLLDPDFSNNHFIYLSYAAENKQRESTTKVIRGKLDGNQLKEVETLFLAAPYSHGLYHYGGGMTFGNDGKLYITIGERNFYEYLNPVPPLSQDITDKRGKIIRINPDGSIPSDNPDFGPKAMKGLYAMGIRASQGLTVDPVSGEIWFSEHGTIQGDELNLLQPGANYGWPHKTSGKYRTKDYNPPVIPGTVFTDPIHFWDQTVAPTGLTFYQGREFPQWNGNIIVPGLSKGSLWRMIIENDKVVGAEELFINDRVRLRKAIVSPRGKLYLLTDEENGKLIRVRNSNN